MARLGEEPRDCSWSAQLCPSGCGDGYEHWQSKPTSIFPALGFPALTHFLTPSHNSRTKASRLAQGHVGRKGRAGAGLSPRTRSAHLKALLEAAADAGLPGHRGGSLSGLGLLLAFDT